MIGDNSIRYILLVIGALAILFILWDGLRRQKRYQQHSAEPLDLKKMMSQDKSSDQIPLSLDDAIISEPRVCKTDGKTKSMTNETKTIPSIVKRSTDSSTNRSIHTSKNKKVAEANAGSEQIQFIFDDTVIDDAQPMPTIALDRLKEIEIEMPKASIAISESEEIATKTEQHVSIAHKPSNVDDVHRTDKESVSQINKHQVDVIVVKVKTATTPFLGYRLLQVLLSQELQLGANKFFNAYTTSRSKEIMFSVASATPPGTFDLATINRAHCDTLIFFADIKHASDPLHVFDTLLSVAQRTADKLGGEVQLSANQACTPQQIENLRRVIRQQKC